MTVLSSRCRFALQWWVKMSNVLIDHKWLPPRMDANLFVRVYTYLNAVLVEEQHTYLIGQEARVRYVPAVMIKKPRMYTHQHLKTLARIVK